MLVHTIPVSYPLKRNHSITKNVSVFAIVILNYFICCEKEVRQHLTYRLKWFDSDYAGSDAEDIRQYLNYMLL